MRREPGAPASMPAAAVCSALRAALTAGGKVVDGHLAVVLPHVQQHDFRGRRNLRVPGAQQLERGVDALGVHAQKPHRNDRGVGLLDLMQVVQVHFHRI